VLSYNPKFSIIIPTFNHCDDLLKPCLESLIKYTNLDNIEIIVVANGCIDNTKEFVESLGSPFILLWFDEPLGYPRAINAGVKSSKSDFIILLNNDVVFLEQEKDRWLDKLLKPFSDNKVGITGPVYCTNLGHNFIPFTLVVIKRQVFEDIGFLDEIFSPGYEEDVDFSFRAMQFGYKIIDVGKQTSDPVGTILPIDFPVFHAGEQTFIDKKERKELIERNSKIILERWGNKKILFNETNEEKNTNDYQKLVNNLLSQENIVNNEEFNALIIKNKYRVNKEDICNYSVLDIGANVGLFSVLSAEYGAKKIISIEPDINNYNELIKNIIRYKNIIPINLAVFSESNMDLYLEYNGVGTRVSLEPNNRLVKSISLSDLLNFLDIEDEVILKMDCEGAEYNILYSASKDDIRRFKIIFIEVHGHPMTDKNPESLLNYLVSMGYEKQWEDVFFEEVYSEETKIIEKNFLNHRLYKLSRKDEEVIIGKEQNLNRTVTAIVSTKDRYFTTLPLTIASVANQIYRPKKIIIFDDGEQRDLREVSLYRNLFALLNEKGIESVVIFGEKKGQVLNHQKSIELCDTEWIWRLDDDNVAEPDVLEKLLNTVTDDNIGAVGGLALDPKNLINRPNGLSNNKIEDIYSGLNIQWFKHVGVSEVDHLYSTFIYRKTAAFHGYCRELSPVGHREETIFTYEMKRNGWRLLVNPEVITWHLREDTGGIRSYEDHALWQHDEDIFKKKMELWAIIPVDVKIVVLNNGLGDHLAFKYILPELKDKYGDRKIFIAACYPEVFKNCDVNIISIADYKLFPNGNDLEKYDIYKMMWDNNWSLSLVDAFRRMYI
jgi:FkbM family methyltransferase